MQLQRVTFGADGTVGTNRFGPRGPRRWPRHVHDAHELLWDARGPLEAETDDGWFVVPPGHGLWIPAGCAHEVTAGDGVPFACTFLGGDPPEGVGARTVVVTVVPAVAELLALLSDTDLRADVRRRVEGTVRDLVAPAEPGPASSTAGPATGPAAGLPLPADPALRAVARAVIARPDDRRTLDEWAEGAGMSARTASRRFREETGTTFAQWRTTVRMRAAVGLLASGMPVGAVARHVGYASASAFVQSFRATVGTTPGAYAGRVPAGRAS
ncbi:helix-turn-helix domain-containing protein [Cellulosimicrobium sp. E-16]|uniref:helix-turn-helix domain-containing protein n=1 Tax=Cellulosimicrobium sp. E-16 TaxID=3404049 RepID=UPI003CF32334